MAQSTPSALPGKAPGASLTTNASGAPSAPSASPPATAGATTGKCGCQGSGSTQSAGRASSVGAGASLQAPSLRPATAGSAGGATATWQSNVHVIGLWSINQDRNCWVYLDNVGWRNLSGASESGLVAMNMVASHAYQLGSTTSLYDEDDGSLSQLYVW